MRDERPVQRQWVLHLVVISFLLFPAALQARYGSPELFGDDISYLDISNAILAGNWHIALSPYWSLGYPLLLTPLSLLFPRTVHGQMQAATALHLLIFLGGWLALLFFLRSARAFVHERAPERLPGSLLVAAAIVFLTTSTCFGRLSTLGPDELVACIFFLASGLLLRFKMRPTAATGAMLGATLGLGYVAKVIFLPLSFLFIAAALLPPRRRLSRSIAFSAPAALLCVMLPYATAISIGMGRPTLGESGALNYAWSVNHLPHWMGWQGGPAALGDPVHPVRLLRDHPAAFGFGEPFHTTYPPQFNLEFWYDGYRHYFSPANAFHAVLINVRALEGVLHENVFFTLGLFFAAIALLYANPDQKGLLRSWAIWLPAVLAIGLYLQVTLEARYILGFVAILALLPFVYSNPARWRRAAASAILLAGCSIDLYVHLRDPIRLGLHEAPVETAAQWKIGHALTAAGLRPGDKVASVTTLNDIRCTWAYAAGLHIVADIGNDAYDPQSQYEDFNLFWTDPAIQGDVLRLFREQGAVAVIAPSVSPRALPLNSAWQRIPNTNAWLLPL